MPLHTNIRKYREAASMTMVEVADVLGITHITEVPNVEVLFGNEHIQWDGVMNAFLKQHGYYSICASEYSCFHKDKYEEFFEDNFDSDKAKALRAELWDHYYFVVGLSVRGVNHICIFQNGEMVHDPHPTKEGLVETRYFESFLPQPPLDKSSYLKQFKTDK